MPAQRGYTTGNFQVEMKGQQAGWIWSCEGGQATSEVVTEKMGSDLLRHKHISTVKYEDISMQIGTGMTKAFWDWVQKSFSQDYARQEGAIVASNYDFKETSRLSFYNALVTEVGFPACDGSSKDAAKVGIKVTPEYTRMQVSPQGGKAVTGTARRDVQMRWIPSNFRLQIDGVDCKRVNKVEAITLKQKVVQHALGELRDYEVEPVSVEVPNLVITLPESNSEALFKWHEDFIVKGNSDASKERGGSLEFLAPKLDKTLVTLQFYGLGLFKVTPDKLDASQDGIRRVKAEFYVERIEFKFESGSYWE